MFASDYDAIRGVWLISVLVLAFYLRDKKEGLKWMCFHISILLLSMYLSPAPNISGYMIIIFSIILISSLLYYYDEIKEKEQQRFIKQKETLEFAIQERTQELHDLNQNLELKIEEKTKEQSLLLSLFDKGDTVLFKWNNNKNWSIDDVSLSIETLTGYTKNDILLGKIDYASFIHQDDIERVRDEVSNAIESNVEFFKHKPYRILTKDGTIKWVLDYTIIVRDKNDKLTHFIGAISDITELTRHEKIILQQSRLAQMGEMISMIAHQWRQPLGAISATSINLGLKFELEAFDLDTKNGQKEQATYFLKQLNNIDGFVNSLTTTIDDFRNFYKPDKKAVKIKVEEVVAKALKIINTSLVNSDIEIIQEYNSNQEIELYDNELIQVILNILKNAQDNFEEKKIKSPKITITTQKNSLSICDNGGGIAEDIMDGIFDPYFSTKDEKNGTGLGLYMSKIIIEEHHNGKLIVENRNGGVCFDIELGEIKQ
jgi:PAS domain S-box-containing protein